MPEDLDLWAKLCEMPRPSKVVDFPRKDASGAPIGQIRLWVLTQEEQQIANAAAENKARDLLKRDGEVPKTGEVARGYADLYANCAAVEILFRACRSVADPKRAAFPSPKELAARLSIDEVGALMVNYYTVMDELGPIVAHMTTEEMNALVEKLGRSGERFPLDLLSPEAVKGLAFSLACLRWNSLTATSSPGSQPASDGEKSEHGDSAKTTE